MIVAMALNQRETWDEVADTDRLLADARATKERLVRELEELRAKLRRVREVVREEASDNV